MHREIRALMEKCAGPESAGLTRGIIITLATSARQEQTKKQTPWPSVRERTIPTERPPLVDEIYSENLVASVIEPGTSGLAARNSEIQNKEPFIRVVTIARH
jgi:hypothetical protein